MPGLLKKIPIFLTKMSSFLDDIFVFVGVSIAILVTFQLSYYAGMYLLATVFVLAGVAIGKIRSRRR